MSKPPANVPAVGDNVRLRGKPAWGVLAHITPLNWARVEWAEDAAGPTLVHLHELVKD